jgi:hypothetical protein
LGNSFDEVGDYATILWDKMSQKFVCFNINVTETGRR